MRSAINILGSTGMTATAGTRYLLHFSLRLPRGIKEGSSCADCGKKEHSAATVDGSSQLDRRYVARNGAKSFLDKADPFGNQKRFTANVIQ